MARILLVEDDPVLGRGLSLNLQRAGHEVTWENQLQTARTSEASKEFDLLILDVNLPDGSGFELCKEMRDKGSRLPILMLTARTDEDSVVTGITAGANDYIRKPFSVRESAKEDAFNVMNMAEIQAALSSSTQIITLLLSIIAAISLVVGGVGIMNIMLVSVTERTREIGLRKAIGGSRRDILAQFLAEAVIISMVGGALGIGLAFVATLAMSYFAGWATTISFGSVFYAFAFSASVGILFGFYPARKASLLQPIEALRHD